MRVMDRIMLYMVTVTRIVPNDGSEYWSHRAKTIVKDILHGTALHPSDVPSILPFTRAIPFALPERWICHHLAIFVSACVALGGK